MSKDQELYANTSNQQVFTTQPTPLRGLKLTGVKSVKTVEIVHPTNPKRTVHIAKTDFDPEVHKRAGKKKIEEEEILEEEEETSEDEETEEGAEEETAEGEETPKKKKKKKKKVSE